MITEREFQKICEEVGLRSAHMRNDDSVYWYMYGTTEVAEYDYGFHAGVVVTEFIIDDDEVLEDRWESRKYCKTTEELREALIKSIKRYKEMMKTIRKHKIDEI